MNILGVSRILQKISRKQDFCDLGPKFKQNQKLFDECCGKNLWTLSDKGFGRCPFAVNAAHLGAFDFADDSVVEVGDAEKLKKYIVDQNFLTACDLCNGRSFSADEITPAIQTRTPLTMEL